MDSLERKLFILTESKTIRIVSTEAKYDRVSAGSKNWWTGLYPVVKETANLSSRIGQPILSTYVIPLTQAHERRRGRVVRAARLWCRESLYRGSSRLVCTMRRLENSLCQPSRKWVPFSNHGRIRQRKAFHQLCPRYSGTLTPTAPTAIRLWETFTFTFNSSSNYHLCKG